MAQKQKHQFRNPQFQHTSPLMSAAEIDNIRNNIKDTSLPTQTAIPAGTSKMAEKSVAPKNSGIIQLNTLEALGIKPIDFVFKKHAPGDRCPTNAESDFYSIRRIESCILKSTKALSVLDEANKSKVVLKGFCPQISNLCSNPDTTNIGTIWEAILDHCGRNLQSAATDHHTNALIKLKTEQSLHESSIIQIIDDKPFSDALILRAKSQAAD
ncbi:unnamed protein product [Owenia fusiformis]|uniref:Uncharacterized protein n=1 Tax=Owenia fusiformis TaxID=6347 RepID=A0A8J1YD01_OWEFU|nr:unnamed protein product [Owenia fusiformis]